MRGLYAYLQMAAEGFREFAAAYKILPLIISILLYMLIRGNKGCCGKKRSFLLYAAAVTWLLLIPVTAAFFLMYQTRFYDYGWVWSFVPLTAVLAWGVVTIIWEELSPAFGQRYKVLQKAGKYIGVAVAVGILWICGNQGQMQELPEETKDRQAVAEAVLQYLEENDKAAQCVVWGPKTMMQYLRSHSGEIVLYYGKDMWDAKSGAYDYEAYTEEETAGYNWMELLADERNLYLLETDQVSEYMHEALAEEGHIQEALGAGVNCMILPDQITPWVERKIAKAASELDLTVSTAQVGEYTVWLLKER